MTHAHTEPENELADAKQDAGAELLPCPHCGSKAWLRDSAAGRTRVECDECQIGQLHYADHAETVAHWNRRAALPGTVQPVAVAVKGNTYGDMIYIASKTKHAERWRTIASIYPVSSTWIYEAGEGESADLHDLWQRCLREAAGSKALVAYREPDEVLKGGWVEIGAALANGIPVHAVGLEEFTIAKYRGIRHHRTMKDAVAAALHEPSRALAPATMDVSGDVVPEGWKIVPIEPTEAMLQTQGKSRPDLAKTDAIRQTAERLNTEIRKMASETWAEMLAASPALPGQSSLSARREGKK